MTSSLSHCKTFYNVYLSSCPYIFVSLSLISGLSLELKPLSLHQHLSKLKVTVYPINIFGFFGITCKPGLCDICNRPYDCIACLPYRQLLLITFLDFSSYYHLVLALSFLCSIYTCLISINYSFYPSGT